MLGIRETRRVTWRRQHASQHYVGYVTVTDASVRLAGRENVTGIEVSLSIPYDAIRKVRLARDGGEEVVGERSVVLELRDDEPIYVRPVCTGPLDLDGFARKLRPN
jgi:tRNA A37 threonylcarbamoyladenosine synthetase subunit TsaC/SUA5/YrdC